MSDDLISRSNLMTTLNIKEDCHDCAYTALGYCIRGSEFANACVAITDAPSINAVEVVRCRDCKHRGEKTINEFCEYEVVFPDDVCPCQCDDYFYSWMPDDDWFCKNGERKE